MSLTNPGCKNDYIANRAKADVDAILSSRDCVLISGHKATKTMEVTINRNSQAPLGLHAAAIHARLAGVDL